MALLFQLWQGYYYRYRVNNLSPKNLYYGKSIVYNSGDPPYRVAIRYVRISCRWFYPCFISNSSNSFFSEAFRGRKNKYISFKLF